MSQNEFHDKPERDTPRTDAKVFNVSIAGGNHAVVFASHARQLERELADALSGTDSMTWEYWRNRARSLETDPPSAIEGSPNLSDLADKLVDEWDADGKMPGMAWDFRGFAVDAMLRALAATSVPPSSVEEPAAYGVEADLGNVRAICNLFVARWEAEQCMNRLDAKHPGANRTLVPLYRHPQSATRGSDDAKDAARYRWLRENCDVRDRGYEGGQWLEFPETPYPWESLGKKTRESIVDEAIDAAMAPASVDSEGASK